MRLAAFQAIIYQIIATASSLITFLASNFVFYVAAMTQTLNFCHIDSTLTHELATFMLSLYNVQEKLENNGRIWNSGILRTDSKQMWAVDGKQRIYLEWPNSGSTCLNYIFFSQARCHALSYHPQHRMA